MDILILKNPPGIAKKPVDGMSQRKYVLMAIKPQFARLIREGKKTVELRRVAPKVSTGDILIIYESAPISKVTSFAEIDDVIQLNPEDLWRSIGSAAMINRSDFDNYFSGKKVGNGIRIKNVVDLPVSKPLNILPNHTVPQNYRYLSENEFTGLCL